MLALTITIPCIALSNFLVKADTSEVKILSYSWYVAPQSVIAAYPDDLVAVGEIQNVGSNNLANVYVVGTAYDANGTALASAGQAVFGNYLLPQQKAPFYLDFNPDLSPTGDLSWVPSVASVNVTVASFADTTDSLYSGLSLSSTSSASSGIYTVAGTITNNGNQASGNVWVVTTFYNASGTVVSLNYTNYLRNSLAPGQSVGFTATPTDNYPSTEITSYSALLQSQLQVTATATPQPTTQPITSPTTTTQPTSTVTPGQGQGTDSTAIIIAAAVVAILVVAAVLLLVKNRKKTPPPPPLAPAPAST